MMVAKAIETCCSIVMYYQAFFISVDLLVWYVIVKFGFKVTALGRNTFAEALLSEAPRSSNSSTSSSSSEREP
jgi:hypothetical protein